MINLGEREKPPSRNVFSCSSATGFKKKLVGARVIRLDRTINYKAMITLLGLWGKRENAIFSFYRVFVGNIKCKYHSRIKKNRLSKNFSVYQLIQFLGIMEKNTVRCSSDFI